MLPRYRRAAAVATTEFGPEGDTKGVAQLIDLQFGFGEAEFLALIKADRAAQGEQQGHEQGSETLGWIALTAPRIPARDGALDVVVVEGPAGPAGVGGAGMVVQQ